MLRYLASPQLRLMTDHQKNDVWLCHLQHFKYFQESLNSWRRKQLKTMKDKSDNSQGRKQDE